jgi:flagellin
VLPSKESEVSISINTNVLSLITQRNLSANQETLSTSMARLSSGLRVNTSKDDAAGMAIAARMETQVRGMAVAQRNAADAISLSQVAEGAIGQVGTMLQRMRELAVQSANATNSTSDRANLDAEFQQLGAEVTRTIANTQFNGIAILAGGAGTNNYQVGPNSTDQVAVATTNLSSATQITGVTGGGITTASAASSAMANIDSALTLVNTQRALMGAVQNRFSAMIEVLDVNRQNTSAAQGRIMDADFAAETANLSRAQILQQAGAAMVAQANSLPQMALQLLR